MERIKKEADGMKKILIFLLAAALLCFGFSALAEMSFISDLAASSVLRTAPSVSL